MKTFTAIIMLSLLALASGCDRQVENTVQGTIGVMPKKLEGTWIVDSGGCEGRKHLVTVTPETVIDQGQGRAAVGARVEIQGHDDGRYLHASQIVVNPDPLSQPPARRQASLWPPASGERK